MVHNGVGGLCDKVWSLFYRAVGWGGVLVMV